MRSGLAFSPLETYVGRDERRARLDRELDQAFAPCRDDLFVCLGCVVGWGGVGWGVGVGVWGEGEGDGEGEGKNEGQGEKSESRGGKEI